MIFDFKKAQLNKLWVGAIVLVILVVIIIVVLSQHYGTQTELVQSGAGSIPRIG